MADRKKTKKGKLVRMRECKKDQGTDFTSFKFALRGKKEGKQRWKENDKDFFWVVVIERQPIKACVCTTFSFPPPRRQHHSCLLGCAQQVCKAHSTIPFHTFRLIWMKMDRSSLKEEIFERTLQNEGIDEPI